ncbi:MAG: BrnA antitoxin family protein [Pseudomonadota bacterium]
MSKTSAKHFFHYPSPEEDAKIHAAALADPDAQPLTEKQLSEMVPLRSLLGRPKSSNRKVLVSVRYSPEVIDYFRSTGDGWQARMDSVLSQYVRKQAKRTTEPA